MSSVVVLTTELLESFSEVTTVKQETTDEREFEALDFGTDSDFDKEESEALDSDDDSDTLTLISNELEPVTFDVMKKAALLSKLVEAILEGDPTATDIPLRHVDGDTLALVVEYLEHHCGKQPAEIPKPIRSFFMKKMVEDLWDAEFINKRTTKEIIVLANASSYLDCISLTLLCLVKIATMVKGRTKEKINEIFGEEMIDKIPEPRVLFKPKPMAQKRKIDKEETAEELLEDCTLMDANADDTKEVAVDEAVSEELSTDAMPGHSEDKAAVDAMTGPSEDKTAVDAETGKYVRQSLLDTTKDSEENGAFQRTEEILSDKKQTEYETAELPQAVVGTEPGEELSPNDYILAVFIPLFFCLFFYLHSIKPNGNLS